MTNKNGLISIVLGVLMLLVAGNANAVMIDFDELPMDSTLSGNEYSDDGILFTTLYGGYLVACCGDIVFGNSLYVEGGSYVELPGDDLAGFDGLSGSHMMMEFVGSSYSTDLQFTIISSFTGWAKAFDVNGVSVGLARNDGFFEHVDFSGRNVHSVHFWAQEDMLVGQYYLDDVSFSLTAAVPEPSTMLLLGSGLFGFGAIGRKIKK